MSDINIIVGIIVLILLVWLITNTPTSTPSPSPSPTTPSPTTPSPNNQQKCVSPILNCYNEETKRLITNTYNNSPGVKDQSYMIINAINQFDNETCDVKYDEYRIGSSSPYNKTNRRMILKPDDNCNMKVDQIYRVWSGITLPIEAPPFTCAWSDHGFTQSDLIDYVMIKHPINALPTKNITFAMPNMYSNMTKISNNVCRMPINIYTNVSRVNADGSRTSSAVLDYSEIRDFTLGWNSYNNKWEVADMSDVLQTM